MTNFAEELENTIIFEWRDKYIQYRILTQLLKALHPSTNRRQTKLIAKRSFALLSLTSPIRLGKYDPHQSSIEIKLQIASGNTHNDDFSEQTSPQNSPQNPNLTPFLGISVTEDHFNHAPTASSKTTSITPQLSPPQSTPQHTQTPPASRPTSPHGTTSITHAPTVQTNFQQPIASIRQAMIDNIDGYNIDQEEEENRQYVEQLTPGLQVIQQQQQETVSFAQLNSIQQIHAFSKELRGKRNQSLKVQPLSTHISNQTLNRTNSIKSAGSNDPHGIGQQIVQVGNSLELIQERDDRNSGSDSSDGDNYNDIKSLKRYQGRRSVYSKQQTPNRRNSQLAQNTTKNSSQSSLIMPNIIESNQPLSSMKELHTNPFQFDDNGHTSGTSTPDSPSTASPPPENVLISAPENNIPIGHMTLSMLIPDEKNDGLDHDMSIQSPQSNLYRYESINRDDIEIMIPNNSFDNGNEQYRPEFANFFDEKNGNDKLYYLPQPPPPSSSSPSPRPQSGSNYIPPVRKLKLAKSPSNHSISSIKSRNLSTLSKNSPSYTSSLAKYTPIIAKIASKRKKITRAEFLAKKHSKSLMTQQLRRMLEESPYKLLEIDSFYQTRGKYSGNMMKQGGLSLETTDASGWILSSSVQLRKALDREYRSQNEQKDGADAVLGRGGALNMMGNGNGDQWDDADDDGGDLDELTSLLSSQQIEQRFNMQNKNNQDDIDNFITPGYSAHRISQLDIPPIKLQKTNKNDWSGFFGEISQQSFDYSHPSLTNPAISQLDQRYYNNLLTKLAKYADIPPLCRTKKYYSTLRALSSYLYKIQRHDLIPHLPQLKTPVEILNDLYPIQLRDQTEIEQELDKLPLLHTFLPIECMRYEVEVLYCNAIQSQIEKISEFVVLLEVYYDANMFNIASVLAQLLYSEILLQQCLTDVNYSNTIDIDQFITMRNHQTDTVKKTFMELYRGLMYLESFQSLNLKGFAKILKKHDKISQSFSFSRQVFLPIIFSTHFAQSTSGFYMKNYLETFFSQIYSDSARELAIVHSSLSNINMDSTTVAALVLSNPSHNIPKSTSTSDTHRPVTITNWVRLGIYAGITLTLIIANFVLYWFYPKAAFESKNFEVGFPLFRTLSYLLIACWMWSLVAYFCERARINYQLILQLNPRTFLRPPQLFEMSSFLTVLGLLCFSSFVFTLAIDPEDKVHHYILYGTLLGFIAMLLNPFPIMHRPTRWYIIKNLVFFFGSPFTPATIQVSIFGNVVSSLNRMLSDLAFMGCYYSKYPITTVPPPADSIQVCKAIMKKDFWFISTIPQVFRGLQGVRSSYYSDEWYPFSVSAMKYFIAIPEAIAQWAMKKDNYALHLVIIWGIFAATRGVWSFIWDITMDWKLPARAQAVSDKYENILLHLYLQDKTIIPQGIDLGSHEHRLHYFGRFGNKGKAKARDDYNKLLLTVKNDSSMPLILDPNNNNSADQLSSNHTSPYYNQSIPYQQSVESNQQDWDAEGVGQSGKSDLAGAGREQSFTFFQSNINENDILINSSQAYLELDSNTTTIISRSPKQSYFSQFRYFLNLHHNVLNFKPTPPPKKYICCGSTDVYQNNKIDNSNSLPQAYSCFSLSVWYFFFQIIIMPFKFILSLLYYPIFYLFVFICFLLTCLPCRSIYRHARFRCKSSFPSICGRPRRNESISRQYWRTHKPTPYEYSTVPNYPAGYLSHEFQSLYFYHPLKLYFIFIIIDFICRNTFIWSYSPNIPGYLGLTSDWLTFFIGVSSLLRRGMWIYLRFEAEQLKLTNKLQALNLEGELIGKEYGGWGRNKDNEQKKEKFDQNDRVDQNGEKGNSNNNNNDNNNNNNNNNHNSNNNPNNNNPGNPLTEHNSETISGLQGPILNIGPEHTNNNAQVEANVPFPSLEAAMAITKLIVPTIHSKAHTKSPEQSMDEFLNTDEIIIDPLQQALVDHDAIRQQNDGRNAGRNIPLLSQPLLRSLTHTQHNNIQNGNLDIITSEGSSDDDMMLYQGDSFDFGGFLFGHGGGIQLTSYPPNHQQQTPRDLSDQLLDQNNQEFDTSREYY